MDYVEHESTMSDAMADPRLAPGEEHVLDPNIEGERLECFFRQLANVLLQLPRLRFNHVGSLLQDEKGRISVSGRPPTQNMSHLMQLTGMPDAVLPSSPDPNIKSCYTALADMHIAQFTFQRNDDTLDEDDARDKFVARLLLGNLYPRAVSPPHRTARAQASQTSVCFRKTSVHQIFLSTRIYA
jgi:hypothetical protein